MTNPIGHLQRLFYQRFQNQKIDNKSISFDQRFLRKNKKLGKCVESIQKHVTGTYFGSSFGLLAERTFKIPTAKTTDFDQNWISSEHNTSTN